MQSNLELLMPAWDMEKMKYAFAYWADAVYVWAPMFSLRARTNAFNMDTLKEAVDYAHALWKKIYFTANIYAHNIKINVFLANFRKMYEMWPDAFIMADPGLIHLVKKEFPDAVIHLSVQQNNVNWAQVEFWKSVWVERVILARELSVAEMKEIHEKNPEVELEAFVHGAICISYSWRCLLSNYMAHRDANQWTCAQSCRWQYKVLKEENTDLVKIDQNIWERGEQEGDYEPLKDYYYLEEKERPGELLPIDEDEYGTHIMNSRDMCAIAYMKEIIDAWIISFKVEWRNKTINYVATVARAYRKAIDLAAAWKELPMEELMSELYSVANRGYIPGFFVGDLKENAQYYEKNGWFQTKKFMWKVVSYDEKTWLAQIVVKNRFEKWDKLEVITPEETWIEEVWDIIKYKWEEKMVVTEAHWGWVNVYIKLKKNPGEFSILRADIK